MTQHVKYGNIPSLLASSSRLFVREKRVVAAARADRQENFIVRKRKTRIERKTKI